MSEQKAVVNPENDWVPQTDAEKDWVRHELKNILRDPLFLASKRYPAFLRYIVEETLEGRGEQLKERTLGIDVFGRKADYDCSLDNIVRATAIETRKRLAEYHARVNGSSAIRIELVAGSYIPRFINQSPALRPPPLRLSSRAAIALLVVLILGVIAAVGWRTLRVPDDPITLFWRPFFDWNGSILLCLGSDDTLGSLTSANSSDPAVTLQPLQSNDAYVRFSSAVHLARFVQFLALREKPFQIMRDATVSLHDLRSSPAILIGINKWAIQLTAPLRFSIQCDPATQMLWISDRQNPSRRDWASSITESGDNQSEDYALISRFLGPTADQWVLATSGLHRFGTRAGAELLSDREAMQALAAKAPRGWDQLNFQLVIATKVVQGHHGRPRILESYFWRR